MKAVAELIRRSATRIISAVHGDVAQDPANMKLCTVSSDPTGEGRQRAVIPADEGVGDFADTDLSQIVDRKIYKEVLICTT